jgi:hypothetical protein
MAKRRMDPSPQGHYITVENTITGNEVMRTQCNQEGHMHLEDVGNLTVIDNKGSA